MKGVARGDGFSDHRAGGRISFGVGDLMPGGVEGFARFGGKRRQADAVDRAAAGVLEMGDLPGQLRLAGTRGGGVQSKNMVKNPHEHLQPFGFAPVHFFNLQPKRGLLAVVYLLHELGKFADFGAHFLGDLFGPGGGFLGLALDGVPLIRGGADLRGELFQILNFVSHRPEGVDLDGRAHGAVIQQKRQNPQSRTEGGGSEARENFPFGNWMR